jgi:SNF2 family DNA or RNA helicase
MLASELKELNPVVVFGGVPVTASDSAEFNREALIRKFLEDPSCRAMIANPAACGESISLHMACHDAIYVDRSFNCAHYLQSLDRIHRLGLPPDTTTSYYLLICQDSIDEIVHHRLKEKMRRMRDVTEGDLPGGLPGYWSEDLGDEEELDLAMVEKHIRQVLRDRDCSQASRTG